MMTFFLILLTLGVPEGDWYRSNSLGQPLGAIPWFRQGEFEWTLRRDKSPGADVLQLYRKGVLVDRRERDLYENGQAKRILVVKDGIPQEEEYYDYQGKIQRSLRYQDGKVAEDREYLYRENFLQKVQIRNAEGLLTGSEEYFRNPDNRLRRVVITDAQGTAQSFQWINNPDGLTGEWVNAQGRQSLRLLTPQGKTSYRREWDTVGPGIQESWTYSDGVPESSELTLSPDEKEKTTYDAQGRPVRKDILKKDQWTASVYWTYEKDQVALEVQETNGRREQRSYTYDEKGQLVGEEIRVNGQLASRSAWALGMKTQEEIFSQGVKTILVEYQDNRRVRETYYQGETVLRTRTLE